MVEDFEKLPIWQQFKETNSEKFNLDGHFYDALSLLEQYYKAFPTYTLHNHRHVYNILNLIGKLLGGRVKDLSSLECIILILSSTFHDIGMVFTNKQLSEIENENHFTQFLDDNLKAKLQFQENGQKLNNGLAEWYCRWMHAKRVWLFINGLDQNPWKKFSIRIPIGHVCESHNGDAVSSPQFRPTGD